MAKVALIFLLLSFSVGAEIISWKAPTEREDGTPINDNQIYGYTIYHGLDSGDYMNDIDVVGGDVEQHEVYVIPGTVWYAVITTKDMDGRESVFTEEFEVVSTGQYFELKEMSNPTLTIQ